MGELKIGRPRGGRYPVKVYVMVEPETKTAINGAAEKYGVAASAIARDAIQRGLRLTLDSLRKQARQKARQDEREAAQEGATGPA